MSGFPNIKKSLENKTGSLNFHFIFQAKLDDNDDIENGGPVLTSEDPEAATPLKKGLLWQQRDKLFSQWKERYFILTTDYLQCFKKGSSRITEMGEFIFKVSICFWINITSNYWLFSLCTVRNRIFKNRFSYGFEEKSNPGRFFLNLKHKKSVLLFNFAAVRMIFKK